MPVVLLCLGSFLLGSVPFGYLIGRACGVDLRKVGSGNIGATNVLRTLGWKAALPAFLLDVAKGMAPPLAAKATLGATLPPTDVANIALLCGVLAVLGHSFSPFLGFRGGKSVATGLGSLLGTAPVAGLAAFGVFVLVYAATKYVSLASLLGSCAAVAVAFLTRQTPLFLGVYCVVVGFVVWRHKPNIGRLLRGEEPKTPLRRSSAEKQCKPTSEGEDREDGGPP